LSFNGNEQDNEDLVYRLIATGIGRPDSFWQTAQ